RPREDEAAVSWVSPKPGVGADACRRGGKGTGATCYILSKIRTVGELSDRKGTRGVGRDTWSVARNHATARCTCHTQRLASWQTGSGGRKDWPSLAPFQCVHAISGTTLTQGKSQAKQGVCIV